MADKGDAEAEADLGYLYAYGIGLPHDEATAMHLYQQAEGHGFIGAKDREAVLHLTGETTTHDPMQSEALLRAASDAGDRLAPRDLLMLYGGGAGVPADEAKAATLEHSDPSAYAAAMMSYIKAIRDCVDAHKFYPRSSVLAGEAGVVYVGFSVDHKTASNIYVTKTAGSEALDHAGMAALASCVLPDPPPGALLQKNFLMAGSFRLAIPGY